jgi:serine/threonine-protein kinase
MATEQIDRETFLQRLRDSGLLTPEQLHVARSIADQTTRGKVIARQLHEKNILTRFQATMLLAGRTDGFILGQYRILDQIGRGGMGRVFKAEHLTMGRIVAIKVLAAQLVRTERARNLFRHEVRAAARLVHPNIVTAYDANQIGDRYFLVMEYVDGPNLSQLVRERSPLPVGEACDLIRQAAVGLQHAHELGMAHRDIKPSNLLLQRGFNGEGCVVKILDFGLARLSDATGSDRSDQSIPAHEFSVMGTPDYLSPEQARDIHSADIRSDLYSLGCTFYFLLTGRPPFAGGSALDKVLRHNSDDPISVRQFRPEIPVDVWNIIQRLMAKKPANRYQTPAELIAALSPFALHASNSWVVPAGPAISPSTETSPWADLTDPNDANVVIGDLTADYVSSTLSATGLERIPAAMLRHAGRRKWLILAVIGMILAAGIGLSFVLR